MTFEAARLHGVWQGAAPGSKDVLRFDPSGRLYVFMYGHAAARDLLIEDVAETDAGLVFRLRSGRKSVVATISQDGRLKMECGGEVYFFSEGWMDNGRKTQAHGDALAQKTGQYKHQN
ncbi:hypothetical protein [Megalodesulfovibrio paquesii]